MISVSQCTPHHSLPPIVINVVRKHSTLTKEPKRLPKYLSETIITAIMTALAVFGRFIPLFKPITAICVMTAVYLGAEAGFLCGSLSVLISNIYFGQGPWTPFQMLGFGLIGLFAGYLSKVLLRHKWLMILYGALAGIAYSFIMDIWTVLWYAGGFDWKLYLSATVSAIPFTALYAVSNVIFLLLLQKPVGNKLQRIKVKYGV